jgi:hypothetical protein
MVPAAHTPDPLHADQAPHMPSVHTFCCVPQLPQAEV